MNDSGHGEVGLRRRLTRELSGDADMVPSDASEREIPEAQGRLAHLIATPLEDQRRTQGTCAPGDYGEVGKACSQESRSRASAALDSSGP